MYLYHTPSGDKTCDGMAMALRAGLPLRDLEMVQFHPTGLLAGPGTRMTGTVLEEGLRGSGGYLVDATGGRFMFEYDPRGERATRDIVSRAVMDRIRKGHTSPNGGVWISMGHLGPDNVRRQFKGMVERCADCGFDLAAGRVEVIPTAHYMMGGVMFAPDCTTEIRGLYAAGEDTGGVHGANRLGGNGVANSTVFGGLAGVSMATALRKVEKLADPDPAALDAARQRAFEPLGRRPGDLDAIRRKLYQVMWDDVGVLRSAEGLGRARSSLNALAAAISSMGVGSTEPRYNLTWMDRLNLENLILASRAICAAAEMRTDSRGAHFREDYPEPSDIAASHYTVVRAKDEKFDVTTEPVRFTYVQPGQTLLPQAAE
jgi:fumarate reductase flavoprotein subunit